MNPENSDKSIGSPPAEAEIDRDLILGLLSDQHPDLADLPLEPIDAGWDNVMYRLGDDLSVRLPRRSIAAPLIENEQNWLPKFAQRLPIPIPAPIRVGRPGRGYPWRWSVVPWLPGTTADLEEPNPNQAARFAAFLRALHAPAPIDAPENPVRGVPLAHRSAGMEERMQRLASQTSVMDAAIREIWEAALEAPVDVEPRWLHGDLHPLNVLVEHGTITGIIDWGDITSGDVATDLASIWMLFSDPTARERAFEVYGPVSDATLHRARGWAVLFGVVLLDSGLVNSPRHAAIGEKTLARIAVRGE